VSDHSSFPVEFADVLGRIARLDPLGGAEPPRLGFSLDDWVDRVVASPPVSPEPDRQGRRSGAWRRRRRRGLLAGALLVVAAGGTAAAIVAARRPDRPNEPALCRADAEPGRIGSGVAVDGPDPLSACASAWAEGLVPGRLAGSVPPLTACVATTGIVEIFPAPAGICEELGLDPAELDPAPPALELQNRLAEATLTRCAPLDEIDALAVSLLGELGLDGWEVTRSPPERAGHPCARVLVDSVTRTVVLVPGPPP
jgi:hypothetical protein